jgi:hypothetical protein
MKTWEDLFWALRYEIEDAVRYRNINQIEAFVEIGKALQRGVDRAEQLQQDEVKKTPEILYEDYTPTESHYEIKKESKPEVLMEAYHLTPKSFAFEL